MAKPSTTQRGYGRAHQVERERWRPKVEAGEVNCARCGEPIKPDDEWDLGHADGDRSRYNGPEHSRQCNRSAGGKRGAAVTNAKRVGTFRDW